MTALCSAGLGEGMGRLCASATAGRVPPPVEGLSVNWNVRDCDLRTVSSLTGEGKT